MAKSAKRKKGDATTTAADRSSRMPTDEATNVFAHDIARRAYDLFLARGCEHGHDREDWLRAERELRDAVDVAVA